MTIIMKSGLRIELSGADCKLISDRLDKTLPIPDLPFNDDLPFDGKDIFIRELSYMFYSEYTQERAREEYDKHLSSIVINTHDVVDDDEEELPF